MPYFTIGSCARISNPYPTTVAIIAAINPYIIASTINGPLMKLRSAPINFIISISSLRLKIAIRIVLKTTSDEITTKTTVAIEPPILANLTQLPTVLIACWRSPENDGSLLGSLYFLYRSSVLIKLFNDCWLFNSFTENAKCCWHFITRLANRLKRIWVVLILLGLLFARFFRGNILNAIDII